jgi:hypothetical protein
MPSGGAAQEVTATEATRAIIFFMTTILSGFPHFGLEQTPGHNEGTQFVEEQTKTR